MTPDEARQLVIDGMNYAAYHETDFSLHDSDKNRLFGSEHYNSGRPVYKPSPWAEGDFEEKMATLLVWANALNRSAPEFTEAQRLLEGEESDIGRIIRRAKNSGVLKKGASGHIPEGRRQAKWERARDFLLYCAIGVSVALFAVLYGYHLADTKQSPESSVKWIGFAIMTGLVFLNAIRSYRGFWTRRKFWALLILFAIAHLSVGFALVSRLGKVGLIAFAFATVAEYFALTAYLDHFLSSKS